MLKNANVILWIIIVMGIVVASYTPTAPTASVDLAVEQSEFYPDPIPGPGEEIYDIEDIMGSIQDSTDQEQE